MADEREVLVEVKNLEVTYGSGRKAYKAVKNANFTIYKGETFGLVGESGSGKTTIGRAIMRILPTSGGEVFYKGQKINGKISHALDKQVIKEIQMIFQDPQSSLNERAKVGYIVGEGLMNVRPDLSAAERDEKVRQALLDVRPDDEPVHHDLDGVLLVLLQLVKWWLCQIYMSFFDQIRHETVQECQKQCTNMCTINIGIGHNDDLVITQF